MTWPDFFIHDWSSGSKPLESHKPGGQRHQLARSAEPFLQHHLQRQIADARHEQVFMHDDLAPSLLNRSIVPRKAG